MDTTNLNASITTIKGVGEKTKAVFEKLNIHTVRDIIMNFPRTYTQYPTAKTISSIEILKEGMDALLITVKKSPIINSFLYFHLV